MDELAEQLNSVCDGTAATTTKSKNVPATTIIKAPLSWWESYAELGNFPLRRLGAIHFPEAVADESVRDEAPKVRALYLRCEVQAYH